MITGGAGFIGSHVVKLFLQKHPTATLVNIDKLTYAGNLENLKEIEAHPNYVFVKGDICDRKLVKSIFFILCNRYSRSFWLQNHM